MPEENSQHSEAAKHAHEIALAKQNAEYAARLESDKAALQLKLTELQNKNAFRLALIPAIAGLVLGAGGGIWGTTGRKASEPSNRDSVISQQLQEIAEKNSTLLAANVQLTKQVESTKEDKARVDQLLRVAEAEAADTRSMIQKTLEELKRISGERAALEAANSKLLSERNEALNLSTKAQENLHARETELTASQLENKNLQEKARLETEKSAALSQQVKKLLNEILTINEQGVIKIKGDSPFTFKPPGAGQIQLVISKGGSAKGMPVTVSEGKVVYRPGKYDNFLGPGTYTIPVQERDYARVIWEGDSKLIRITFIPNPQIVR